MVEPSYIYCEHIHFHYPQQDNLLKDISCSFAAEKTAIVGSNGCGKSTLLQLLLGKLQPSSGILRCQAKLTYCPQDLSIYHKYTIAELFQVADKLTAYANILNGSSALQDYEALNDDWDVVERLQQQLTDCGLEYLQATQALQSLSGGEQTRLVIAAMMAQSPDVLILDEPTNNLDKQSRDVLYSMVEQWQQGLIVVSHDRQLLRYMDRIIELNANGMHVYGGNFDAYWQQKQVEQQAIERRYSDAKKDVVKTQRGIQQEREKHEQGQRRGRLNRKTGSQTKLYYDAQKGKSENHLSTLKIRHKKQQEQTGSQYLQAREQLLQIDEMTLHLPETQVANQKIILELQDVNFKYLGMKKKLLTNMNLIVKGPERIALSGNNGSGKTSLVKLILGELTAEHGTIKLGTDRVCYLDQAVNILQPKLTLLDNFQYLNPDCDINSCYAALAQFLFRNQHARRYVAELSGGEKLRAALACVLMGARAPQLLILDEPTNHLDFISIASIEKALQAYQGALLVISHDVVFLENIQIERALML